MNRLIFFLIAFVTCNVRFKSVIWQTAAYSKNDQF
jgi:hypothetical protein